MIFFRSLKKHSQRSVASLLFKYIIAIMNHAPIRFFSWYFVFLNFCFLNVLDNKYYYFHIKFLEMLGFFLLFFHFFHLLSLNRSNDAFGSIPASYNSLLMIHGFLSLHILRLYYSCRRINQRCQSNTYA